MYHFNHILYTVILIAVPFMTFIIWSIVGRPRIVKPKQSSVPRIVDYNLSKNVEKMIAAQRRLAEAAEGATPALRNAAAAMNAIVLDEHETKIS